MQHGHRIKGFMLCGKNLLYIIHSLHHVYLTHQLLGLPVYTSNMASPPTKHQVTEVKRTTLLIYPCSNN